MVSSTNTNCNGAANGLNNEANDHEEYKIPDVTFRAPENRRVKVIGIGAGMAGILTAYQIQKTCENVDFQLYEKLPNIGGTWLANRYPGCACDVPSHAYSLSFALNPEWNYFFSPAQDILEYLEKVVQVFDLRKYMQFNSEILSATWNDQQGKWIVKIRQRDANGNVVSEFEDSCDIFLQSSGVLSHPKLPKIGGIDKFKGKIVHTGDWDDSYTQEQWKNETVAVLGSGASSIQTVPNMQPHVKKLDVFVRTPIWFTSMANNYGNNHAYTDEEKHKFRTNTSALAEHARGIENDINGDWNMFFSDTKAQLAAQDEYRTRMAKHITNERLLNLFTPKWAVGCRRVSPGDPYMKAIQESNVDVHFTAVRELTEDGVIGEDGIERKVDTVVCATGFHVDYHPHFPVVGLNGRTLKDYFGDEPTCYLGITVPNFPNYVMFGAPTWPVMNGSALGPLQACGNYAVQMIKKLQQENIKSLTPKQEVADLFNRHVQEFVKASIWKEECRSWYKNPETGKVFAVWPGSSLHYSQTISAPRYEDYNITYHNKNMWGFLGYGFTQENRDPNKSTAPYLIPENIDPKWLATFQK